MPKNKTLIVYMSIHHGNTEKIAREMAKVLEADLKKPYEASARDLDEYDLIGFGSGTYFYRPHIAVMSFLDKLPDMGGKKAFLFMTYGAPVLIGAGKFKKAIKAKGFDLAGEYYCRGFDTWGPLKLIGGIAKGRPNEKDLEKARRFSANLKNIAKQSGV